MLIQIDLGNAYKQYACAGLVCKDEKVVEAAPIVGYMIGWHLEKVQTYCAKKGWFARVIG